MNSRKARWVGTEIEDGGWHAHGFARACWAGSVRVGNDAESLPPDLKFCDASPCLACPRKAVAMPPSSCRLTSVAGHEWRLPEEGEARFFSACTRTLPVREFA